MGKHGVIPARVDMFGPGGTAQLDALDLPIGYSCRLESLRDLIAIYDREVTGLDRRIAAQLVNHQGYRAIQALNGVGPVLAAVFVAEIGDVTRFSLPGPVVLVGGDDTPAPGVRHQGPPRRNHQTRLAGCCAGPRSRRSRRTTAAGTSKTPTGASPSAGAATSPGSPRPADFSPSCTTGCATARSAASPSPARGESARTQPADRLEERHDPQAGRRM